MTGTASATDRRPQTRQMIDHMLAERDAMLMLLWKVSGREGALPESPDHGVLDEFNALLVDYIAAGHFGLYQRLTEGTERRQPVLDVAGDIYPRIAATTEAAIAFNDRYAERSDAHLDPRLPDDLANLAELLAERMVLEDQLIAAMVGAERRAS